ncbi:MAG: pseudouridine synthase, partial [Dehalococcoidia bacterium]
DIAGARTTPAQVRSLPPRTHPAPAESAWLEITIHEGRNRQVRQMCDAVGLTVQRLLRTRVGPIRLTGIRGGAYRPLAATEVRSLRETAGLPVKV